MRLYRLLLHFYPVSFRHEYGREMCAIFAEHRRRVRGPLAVMALWAETLVQIVSGAARVHWDILQQDVKYAARTFAQSPGFAVTAVVVTALGIGATTAVFSLADHVMIRPLPYPESHRLVKLLESVPGYQMELSPANFRDWKLMSTSFDGFGAYTSASMNFVGDGLPERVEGSRVTGDLLPLLRVQPLMGRHFLPEEDVEGAPPAVMLSYGLWQRRFGGDSAIVGKSIRLDDVPHLVIGVMPHTFHFPTRTREFWIPFRFRAAAYEDRNDNYIYGVARLRDGVSLEQARAEMNLVAAQLEKEFPAENEKTGAVVFFLRDEFSSQARLLLMALVGAAVCVLLIACSNLANLLLARALERRKELAVRAALGAGRERLARQLLTESLSLAALGGTLGVFLASAALPLLTRLVPHSLPIADVPALDWRVLLFAAAVTLLTGIAFGVAPALRLRADAGATGLRDGGRTGIGGQKQRVRAALVVAEVVASVVLLASSGLLIRALWKLQEVDPGFRAEGVMTARTWLPWPKYEQTERRHQFYSQVLTEVEALPGVTSAAYISYLPMTMRGGIWPVSLDGRPVDRAGDHNASMRFVTPGFFKTMAIPMLAGRDVSLADTQQTLQVAVVSESFAKQFFPGQDPIGRTFHYGVQLVKRTIVGVVGDVRVRGIERSSEPQVYLPHRQVNDGWMIGYPPRDLAVRTSQDPVALATAIREIVQRVDPQQPVSDVRTLEQIVAGETAPRRAQLGVLAAFATVSFTLAAIGIYGLLSFAVAQRTQEIGVRLALGATRSNILGLILRGTVVLALTGTAIGIALAFAAGRSLSALLAGVQPTDPATMLAAAALAILMALLGCAVPAIRAMRVDPATALRNE